MPSSSSSVVFITEERIPLLQSNNDSEEQQEEEIIVHPSSSTSNEQPDASEPNSALPHQRLVSLDVFRGLTVALMILVDDAGGAFPSINHSPWFGVTLADFVMPFFLFGVGVSIGLVFKNLSCKTTAVTKVILRTIKLFFLGLVLQGGYFHGRNHLTYGVDIEHIRWLGVLQRISIGYFLAAFSEIWFVGKISVDSAITFIKKYYVQWMVAALLCSLYMGLLYGIYVPNWKFEVSSSDFSLVLPNYGSGTQIVNCGVRSSLEPPCNAVGFIDRLLLGAKHLYQNPVYRRTKECSVNSPDYGPLPANAPGWCLAPFDPEGILSSLMAATTCFIGLHFGHIILHYKSHTHRIFLWIISSLLLLLSGYGLEVLGMPVSKPLYTLSYMCITAGASGLVLTTIYYIELIQHYYKRREARCVLHCNPLAAAGSCKSYCCWCGWSLTPVFDKDPPAHATMTIQRRSDKLVDVKCFSKPTILFQWMGMNALLVYALAACEIFPAAIQGLYWRSPPNNLVNGTELLLQTVLHSERWGTLVFVLVEILFWCIVAGYLHMKGIYVKI